MALKKAELHVHLEGTITPNLAIKLAKRNRVTLPNGLIAADNLSYISKNFLDFLKVYDKVAAVIKLPQDYYDITFDYLKASAIAEVIYVEMMYSPAHAELSSNIPSTEHLAAIAQAIDDARLQYGIVSSILITAVRHFGAAQAEKIAQQIHTYKDKFSCVTGFGLGGDEANYPPRLFIKTYQIAAEAGLDCTIHAGEFASATSMVEAMNFLPIKRIGHGINCMHSPDTIAMLKDKAIALELCPSSNIFLGLFKDMHRHPLPRFYELGIKISINSDDPPFMATTLAKEYKRVQKAYHYSDEKMNKITNMAIKAAFINEATKQDLLLKI